MSIFKVKSGGIDTVCVGHPEADGTFLPLGWVIRRLDAGDDEAALLARWPHLTSTDLAAVHAYVRARFVSFAGLDAPATKPDDDDGNYIR